MEILFCRNYPDGYNKISAIKPDGWKWGDGELDEKVFGIMKVKDDELEKILSQEVLDEKEVAEEKTTVDGKEVIVKKEITDAKQIASVKLEKHSNENSLCVDSKFESLVLTPENFKIIKAVSSKGPNATIQENIKG